MPVMSIIRKCGSLTAERQSPWVDGSVNIDYVMHVRAQLRIFN